ncbi:cystatin-11 isoform X2 [Macaca nemestrina]|uniref:Cystatin 11 n=2 Tax=Macaca TaxID=9539 RepID=A0A2K5WKQ1_MACFA|nr:cystatin-11 isoform X2 [Macaca nemestrina]XP_045218328.1 cystatin-11 isoform X2 [Macaca fascicularis]
MMAEPWQALRLLLAILLTLMTLTYQARKKTFLSVQEVTAIENYAKDTLQWITDQYNKESDDKYHFRIFRVLKVEKRQVNCFFSVFAIPWFEQYKILNKTCSSD